MKIVLSSAPRAMGEIERGGLPFLSLGYLASSLESDGHQVSIIDPHTFSNSIEEAAENILTQGPAVVGLTATSHNRLRAIELIKLIKKKNPRLWVVVGGPHFSLTGPNALKIVPEIDFVVKREGELILRELIKSNFNQGNLSRIAGLVYRNEKKEIIENSDHDFIKNLDELPKPAWHLFDLNKYQGTAIEKTGLKTIGLISSRGCPNQCIYCANLALQKGVLRLRSPQNFVDEIVYLKNQYGYRAFNFWDDTMTIVRSHVLGICQELLKRKLDIKWYARARVNTVDKELLTLMKEAGCVRVNFGIESGSPRMLKVIKKGINLEQARRAVKIASDLGLEVTTNFIVNLPSETLADIKMTTDLMKELRRWPNVICSYGMTLIYPGTAMELMAKEQGILAQDFSWNKPFKTEKYRLTGEDPSVPYMEWPGMELERVKSFIVRELDGYKGILIKGLKKLKRIKSWNELKSLIKAGLNLLKI